MGFLLDIYCSDNSFVVTVFKIFSIGIAGDTDKKYYATTLHLRIWKLELTTSLGWRKNGKKNIKP